MLVPKLECPTQVSYMAEFLSCFNIYDFKPESGECLLASMQSSKMQHLHNVASIKWMNNQTRITN